MTLSTDQLKKLTNADSERSYIKGIVTFFDAEDSMIAILKTKPHIFSSEARETIFKIIVSLDDKRVKYSAETVGLELYGKGVDEEFIKILQAEPSPNLEYVLTSLSQLAKSRRVYLQLLESANQLLQTNQVSPTLFKLGEFVDSEMSERDGDLITYAEHRKRVEAREPKPKYSTGLKALDTNLWFEGGSLIVILAEPEVGKSVLLDQMAESFAGHDIQTKAMICPFEFSAENYVERKMSRDGSFDHEKLYVEDEAMELSQLKIKILQAVKQGVKFVGIDSQMSLTSFGHTGREEGMETKKFEMLSSLCIRHDLVIVLIAQQASGVAKKVYGTAKGNYLPKVIIHLAKEYDKESGDEKIKLVTLKNKISNVRIDMEVEIVSSTVKMRGVFQNKRDNSGRKKKNDDGGLPDLEAAPFEVIYEDDASNSASLPFIDTGA
jgi:KaiC/GvpD/RAD55 family RecA-like ATPase